MNVRVLFGPVAVGFFSETAVGQEPVRARGADQQTTRAFVALPVVQFEAGQVKSVGRMQDEQDRDVGRVHEGFQGCDA